MKVAYAIIVTLISLTYSLPIFDKLSPCKLTHTTCFFIKKINI